MAHSSLGFVKSSRCVQWFVAWWWRLESKAWERDVLEVDITKLRDENVLKKRNMSKVMLRLGFGPPVAGVGEGEKVSTVHSESKMLQNKRSGGQEDTEVCRSRAHSEQVTEMWRPWRMRWWEGKDSPRRGMQS